MNMLTRWIAPAVFATGIAAGALLPTVAHAQDPLTRVLVDVADVVIRSGTPYYRYDDDYRYDNRLRVRRAGDGRPVYFRYIPFDRYGSRAGKPHRDAYGYYDNRRPQAWNNGRNRNSKCNKHGKCKVSYYDPRHDRDRYDDRDDRRWRDHDDD